MYILCDIITFRISYPRIIESGKCYTKRRVSSTRNMRAWRQNYVTYYIFAGVRGLFQFDKLRALAVRGTTRILLTFHQVRLQMSECILEAQINLRILFAARYYKLGCKKKETSVVSDRTNVAQRTLYN